MASQADLFLGLIEKKRKQSQNMTPYVPAKLPPVQLQKPQGFTASPSSINVKVPSGVSIGEVQMEAPSYFEPQGKQEMPKIQIGTFDQDSLFKTTEIKKPLDFAGDILQGARGLAGKAAPYVQGTADFFADKIQKGGPTPFGYLPPVPTEAEADSGNVVSGLFKNIDRTLRSGLTGVLDGVFQNSAHSLQSFSKNKDLDALMSGFIATISTIPSTAPMMAAWNSFLETEGGKVAMSLTVDPLVNTGDKILKVKWGYDDMIDRSGLSDKWKYEAKAAPRHALALAGFHILNEAWNHSTTKMVDLIPKEYVDRPIAEFLKEVGAPKRIAIERKWVQDFDAFMKDAPSKVMAYLKGETSHPSGHAQIGGGMDSFYNDKPSGGAPKPEVPKPIENAFKLEPIDYEKALEAVMSATNNLDKAALKKLANKYTHDGMITGKELAEFTRMSKDKDMGPEDLGAELASYLELGKDRMLGKEPIKEEAPKIEKPIIDETKIKPSPPEDLLKIPISAEAKKAVKERKNVELNSDSPVNKLLEAQRKLHEAEVDKENRLRLAQGVKLEAPIVRTLDKKILETERRLSGLAELEGPRGGPNTDAYNDYYKNVYLPAMQDLNKAPIIKKLPAKDAELRPDRQEVRPPNITELQDNVLSSTPKQTTTEGVPQGTVPRISPPTDTAPAVGKQWTRVTRGRSSAGEPMYFAEFSPQGWQFAPIVGRGRTKAEAIKFAKKQYKDMSAEGAGGIIENVPPNWRIMSGADIMATKWGKAVLEIAAKVAKQASKSEAAKNNRSLSDSVYRTVLPNGEIINTWWDKDSKNFITEKLLADGTPTMEEAVFTGDKSGAGSAHLGAVAEAVTGGAKAPAGAPSVEDLTGAKAPVAEAPAKVGGYEGRLQEIRELYQKKAESGDLEGLEESRQRVLKEISRLKEQGSDPYQAQDTLKIIEDVIRSSKTEAPAVKPKGINNILTDALQKTIAKAEAPAVEVTLPQELRGAKPRYGYGEKLFELDFKSDIDKALYIVSNAKKLSPSDGAYMAFLRENFPGESDAAIRSRGVNVRERIKLLAKDSESGVLSIEKTPQTIMPGKKAKPTKAGPPELDSLLVNVKQVKNSPPTPAEQTIARKSGPVKAKKTRKQLDDRTTNLEVTIKKIQAEGVDKVAKEAQKEIDDVIAKIESTEPSLERVGAEKERYESNKGPAPYVGKEKGGYMMELLKQVKEDKKGTGSWLKYIANIGYTDMKLMKIPELLNRVNDYNAEKMSSDLTPVELMRELVGNATPEEIQVGMFDVYYRRLLDNIDNGKPVPGGLSRDGIIEMLNLTDADMARLPEAQRVKERWDIVRRKMLKDMQKNGIPVSQEMFDNVNYVPLKVLDDFEGRINVNRNQGTGEKAPFQHRQKGSELAVNVNFPQVIMEMLQQGYRVQPYASMIKWLQDNMALKGSDGKPIRPTSKGETREGYLQLEFNPLEIFPVEVVKEVGGEQVLSEMLSLTRGETWWIRKEAAEWLAREKKRANQTHSMIVKANGLFKSIAVLSNPVKYLMRNLYSDAVGGLIYAKSTIRYTRYWGEAWGDLIAYYATGSMTPTVKAALENAILQSGFLSETASNRMLDNPRMADIRKNNFLEDNFFKNLQRGGKDFLRIQEAVARIALAKDLGNGEITRASAAEAKELLVDYAKFSDGRRVMELPMPFLQWATGTMQSLLKAMTGQTKFMELTKGEKVWRGIRTMGVLGGLFLMSEALNNMGDPEDKEERDIAQNASDTPNNELEAYQIDALMKATEDLGAKVTDIYIPNNYIIWRDRNGKPYMTDGGGVLLITLDSPLSALDSIGDPLQAGSHGWDNFRQWAGMRLSPVLTVPGELATGTQVSGWDIVNENATFPQALGANVSYAAQRFFPWIRNLESLYNSSFNRDGVVKNGDDALIAAMKYGVPVMVLNVNKLKVKYKELSSTEFSPVAIRETLQRRKDLKKLDEKFKPFIKDWTIHRINQQLNLPGKFTTEFRGIIPGEEKKAREAWDYLRSLPNPVDQVDLVKGLFLDLRAPEDLEISYLTPPEQFVSLYLRFDDARKNKEKNPDVYSDAKRQLFLWMNGKTNFDNIIEAQKENKDRLEDAFESIYNEGITPEMKGDALADKNYQKLLNLTGKSRGEIFAELDSIERFLFGKTPDQQVRQSPFPGYYGANQPASIPPAIIKPQMPGVGATSYAPSVKKKDDRKKVELKPVSYLNKLTPYNY